MKDELVEMFRPLYMDLLIAKIEKEHSRQQTLRVHINHSLYSLFTECHSAIGDNSKRQNAYDILAHLNSLTDEIDTHINKGNPFWLASNLMEINNSIEQLSFLLGYNKGEQ